MFLEGAELTIEAAKEVHHPGDVAEVGFEIVGAGSLVKEDPGEAGGGGLKAHFGQFGGIVAAEMIEKVILVEAVLEDKVLVEAPFEITAGGPVGDVTFSNVETAFIEGEDDVFVVDAVAEHAVDHVALKFWEAGDAAGAAGLALGGGGQAGRVDGRWRTVDG